MSIPIAKRRFHYYNPIELESRGSAHLFGIPRLCGYECNYPGDSYRIEGLTRGSHVRALFKYTCAGSGELKMPDRAYRLTPGTAMLLTGPADYCYHIAPEAEQWEFLFISFWHPTAVGIMERIVSDCGNVFRLEPDGEAMNQAWSLYELLKTGEITDPYSASQMGYDFMMRLCHEALYSSGKTVENEILQRVSNYCFRHLNKAIAVGDLARLCGYSRWHFTKLFHRAAGMSPSAYIMEMKLNAALQILQHENVSIKETAYRCGFEDQGYFGRRFRARFGVSPAHFDEIP